MGSPENRLVKLLELYDDTYRIVNHDDPAMYTLVKYTEDEDPVIYSGYAKYLDEYLKNGIKENFGFTYDEWMAHPYYQRMAHIEAAVRHATDRLAKENKTISDVERELKNGLLGLS